MLAMALKRLQLGLQKLEATSLRVASGAHTLEIGRLAVEGLTGDLQALGAAGAELAGVRLRGPLALADAPAAVTGAWSLDPLAAAHGTVRAEIVDAHLLFDADVTVPIRHGEIDFDAATVEHVGPDSRMGVSRMGLYVDAASGRSYLYQFPATPVAGVAYEQRGSRHGKLQLQPFTETLLGQPPGKHVLGFTQQARGLLERTAMSGEIRLGDGKLAAPGLQAELAGSAEGRNTVRLHSKAVGRGVSFEVASFSVRNVVTDQLACDHATGALLLELFVEGGQLRVALSLEDVKLSGLRLRSSPGEGADGGHAEEEAQHA